MDASDQESEPRQQRVEQHSQEGEDRFKLIAQATTDALWDWDLLSDKIWWSDGVKHLFGLSPHEMGTNGGAWEKHIHPADKTAVLTSMTECKNSNADRWRFDYRVQRQDGSYAFIQNRGFDLHEAG